jgi:hypothetical protein
MKKLITFIAVLLISAGFSPAASSLLAQGEYGPYSDQQGAPPPPPAQNQAPQSPYPAQATQPPSAGNDQSAPEIAQDTPQNQQEAQADASAQPGVARASYIHGDVSSQRGDNSEMVPVTINTPLEAGDRVSTAHDARAEFELDYGDQLRLSGDATAKIANLSGQNIQIQLGQGLATYSVLPGSEAQVEIDTPNAALHPDGQGDYRVLVNSDAETEIIVRTGAADVSTPQGSTHVNAGQMITIAGTDSPQYRIDNAPGRDDWDTWNADRDRRVQTAQSFKNTDPYYTGSEDLDTYGTWSEVPDYGNVWFPNYGADWAPYRDGSWVYEPYYGWTWVSYEPWGWAPYHYGRWSLYGGRWGWWPGAAYVGYRPIWGPAYVSFFGWGGGGFSFGFGFGGWGHVGWLPVGPGDWYHPWYGRFGGRFNAIGFRDYNTFHEGFGPLHTGFRGAQYSNIHQALANDRMRSGISSMNGGDFGHGRVPMNQGRISAADFNGAKAMTGRMPMTPSRESFSPTGRPANASAFHTPPSSQHFFTPNRSNGGFNANGTARTQSGVAGDRNGAAKGTSGFSRPTGGTAEAQGNRASNWHSFTPPSSTNRPNQGAPSQGFNGNRGAVDNRGATDNRGTVDNNRGGGNNNWQQFSPQSRQSQPQQDNRNYAQPNNTNRNPDAGRNYDQQAPRGNNGYNGRPTLNMRQPVVSPRGGENTSRGGGNFSAPRGGNYSAPRGGGGGSAPRGGGGGSTRGSGGGGGGSHGGGGGHHR